MKISFLSSFGVAPLLATGLLGMSALPASASFLIQVDVSNPASVIFTSLDANPLVDDSGTFTFEGITLLDFFTAPQNGSSQVAGDLGARGLGSYTRFALDNASGDRVDLNFFVENGIETQVFDKNKRAFEGASTLLLTPVAGFLPGEGVLGDIIVGFSRGTGSSGTVIGQWRVVPEVSTCAPGVLGLALAGWLVWRRCGTSAQQA